VRYGPKSDDRKKTAGCILKVPKCEIFDRSDLHDFYAIKPFWVGDTWAPLNEEYLIKTKDFSM
jgi:hypothetical protein